MNRIFKHLKYPLKYPGIVPRAVSNYLRLFLFSQPRLRAVEFALTYQCLCDCRHCSAAFLKKGGEQILNTDQVVSALDQMWRLGAMNINLTGGEALLRPDLEPIVRAAHPKSTVVALATSGDALDARAAASLRRWGIRVVTISLDSADPDTHDQSRGRPGSHRSVMDATQYCREQGIDVFWCTIMTHENYQNGDLLRMVKMAGDKGVTLTINFPCPVGNWWDQDLAPTPDERQLHRDLMKTPHVRWEGHSNFGREGCPAGIEKLYISPYGDVMPCPFIHISYGNLKKTPLAQIWKTMLDAGPFNSIRDSCPVSVDKDFAERQIKPIYQQGEHPIPHDRHPACDRRSK